MSQFVRDGIVLTTTSNLEDSSTASCLKASSMSGDQTKPTTLFSLSLMGLFDSRKF